MNPRHTAEKGGRGMNIGTIEVKIQIRLDQNVTTDEAREFIKEMDCEIRDTTGKVSIQDYMVIESNIPQ